MTRMAILALLALAACGADGPPVAPSEAPGVTVSGTVEFGVTGRG
ncbi:argininosuccinate lyase [Frigidibacter mobilis]|uniref:Argininosuccinate lyase n=1 Tax=Frigidibacter mobilis TaxID=1335048 RepID=A0A159Z0J9_9RHOB|nr:argininosuccinate lyase [Frigidibacter mobilis]AMY67428.1 hypothetical protein AKL17_0166 [Frigidibacter mobilis]